MDDLFELPMYANFRRRGQGQLLSKIGNLLNCSVRLDGRIGTNPQFRGIDIDSAPERSNYVISDDDVLLVSFVKSGREIVARVGFWLSGGSVGLTPGRLLNNVAQSATGVLSDAYRSKFRKSLLETGDSFVHRVIANSISKGHYDGVKISFLLDYLDRIRQLTFESEHFSTGIILTRSHYAYAGKHNEYRGGRILQLRKPVSILNERSMPRRLLYTADGRSTFFLMNRQLQLTALFVSASTDTTEEDYFENRLLHNVIRGSDILFRVITHTQSSFTISGGVEFTNIENNWRVRDYLLMIRQISLAAGCEETLAKTLLMLGLKAAESATSAILWIPDDDESWIRPFIRNTRLFRDPASILDAPNWRLVDRMISSDGATVIRRDGRILAHGCVVDLSKASGRKQSGLSGTGQLATRILAEKGVGIKISKDGTITMYSRRHTGGLMF